MILQALLPFFFLASVPLAAAIGADAPWLILPALLVTFTTLDVQLGQDSGGEAAERSWADRLPLWLYVPAQLAVTFWCLALASRSDEVGAFAGLAVSTGVMAGIFGMLVAHELVHSAQRAERALGVALLAAATYPHFRISHLHGHHRLAGTRADPATARRGESAYRFVLRSATGQLAQAWRFERQRVAVRSGVFRPHRLHLYLAVTLALYGAIAVLFGWRGVVFFLVQSLVAIFILELFNYIAHYGLERRVGATGTIEKMRPHHSWNALQRFNNLALLNGGHHSRHHQAPTTSYRQLGTPDAVPLLPAGFAGSIFLALIPPVWRRVMDPRIDRWQESTAEPTRPDEGTGPAPR